MPPDPLALPPDEMRRLGYAAVDALVEATTDWSMPPIRRAAPGELRALLGGPAPEAGIGATKALDRLLGDVVPHLARLDHPRFTAATDLELLVLPEGALETVMRLSPRLTAAVEAAAATRLP